MKQLQGVKALFLLIFKRAKIISHLRAPRIIIWIFFFRKKIVKAPMIRWIFTHFKIKAARNCYNLKLQKDERIWSLNEPGIATWTQRRIKSKRKHNKRKMSFGKKYWNVKIIILKHPTCGAILLSKAFTTFSWWRFVCLKFLWW